MRTSETPETAGLLRRLAAAAYDLLLLAALLMLTGVSVLALRGGEAVPAGTYWFQLLLFLMTALFYIGFWSRGGQTLGMRSWRLRAEKLDGTPLDLPTASLRFLAACLSIAPAGAGMLWILIDKDRRAWHDRMTRTRVVVLSKEDARR